MAKKAASKSPKKAKSPKVKRAKKAKDPNAPKRSLSGFFFFANEKRSGIMSAHKDWKVSEVGSELGRLWRGMSAAQKKPYEDKAVKDKARYEAEMKKYKGKK